MNKNATAKSANGLERILEAGDERELVQLVAAALAVADRAATTPRLLLNRAEAAASLAMSPDHFDAHVRGELRSVRKGRLTLYPVVELERWVAQNAARAFE